MQPFLEYVLEDLDDWTDSPGSFVFVLPSKRAGFFLRDHIARRASGAMLLPEIWSIEDFVQEISGIRTAGTLHLLFRLYEAYLDQNGLEQESFGDFMKWGPLLLQDFNEIDRYLTPADELFKTLSALNEIRQWTPDRETTPMMERRLAFWATLLPVYKRFRGRLLDEGLGYQGLVYRQAVSRLDAFIKARKGMRFVFVGFNALNTAESSIIQRILQDKGARIYWDADPHYLDNSVHEAGFFMRSYRQTWPALQQGLKGLTRQFGQSKEIHLIGVPKAVTQAKYCGDLLKKLQAEGVGQLSRTALILGDEMLLNPVLHSLPDSVHAVNITMSYPLAYSSPAQLLETVFRLHGDRGKWGWRMDGVLDLISHPFLQDWFRTVNLQTEKVRKALFESNAAYAGAELLNQCGVPGPVSDLLFPEGVLPAPALLGKLLELLTQLQEVSKKAGDRLNLEYLFHLNKLLNQLQQLCGAYPFLTDVRSLHALFKQTLSDEKVDFQGEPLEGLQVMGMLESRNLDYETVLITSLNEGVLPAGKSNSSFIPFEVKREFGLPTYKDKDAVYAYHFYRLLQRAKRIFICYNTEPDVLEGGEPSRFIHQMRTDPALAPYIREHIAAPAVESPASQAVEIGKDASLQQRLAELATSGFSPTSLARYILDPLEFYKRNVLGIRESNSLETTVAANTFGTILHAALEDLYRPLIGEVLTVPLLRDLRKRAPGTVDAAFRSNYLQQRKPSGRNLIALEVMKQYLNTFLDQEEQLARRHEVRILGVEQELRHPLILKGSLPQAFIKGTVDRIEEVDGMIRIIDYKTGLTKPSQLRISEWESLRTDPERSKALQVLCYGWLYAATQACPQWQAGILSFKNLGQGRQWFGYQSDAGRSEIVGQEQLESFTEQLRLLCEDILNPAVPFAPAPV